MYSVEYTAHTINDMNKLPAEVKTKIFSAVSKIKEDPYEHVKKLKTSAKTPLYSLRVGEYRVIMAIKDPVLIIQVVEIGNRSKIYRNYWALTLGFLELFKEHLKKFPALLFFPCRNLLVFWNHKIILFEFF